MCEQEEAPPDARVPTGLVWLGRLWRAPCHLDADDLLDTTRADVGLGVEAELFLCPEARDVLVEAVAAIGTHVDPAGGASANPPITSAWGVPIRRDPWWPSTKVGTALIIERSEVDIYTGAEYRIDVSADGGNRFDQNITGFRAEEEFGFNAEPYVRTGRVQEVTGL